MKAQPLSAETAQQMLIYSDSAASSVDSISTVLGGAVRLASGPRSLESGSAPVFIQVFRVPVGKARYATLPCANYSEGIV